MAQLPHEKMLQDIGNAVCEAAWSLFCDCGAEDDFGIQSVSCDTVIFGGTNRVIWSGYGGFRVSRTHCTPRFLENWDNLHICSTS